MEQYIPKDALAAEIKKIKLYIGSDKYLSDFEKGCNFGREDVCDSLLNFIDTLEVKEANEALQTEYEKGRADVIEKTLKWLWDLNQEHEIMSYTDSHVLSSDELQKYYKNNIEE